MTAIPEAPIHRPEAWTPDDLAGSDDWIHVLSPAEAEDLSSTAARLIEDGLTLAEVSREEAHLPVLGPVIARWLDEIDRGRGLKLVRGVPVWSMTPEQTEMAWWMLGCHLGRPVAQNAAGDLLGHVRDTGDDPDDPSIRLYRTRVGLGFHTDGADIIGLMCLHPAERGGLSLVTSSVTLFNRFAARRPDLVPVLFEPYPYDLHDQQPEGAPPYFTVPICQMINGRLNTFYVGWYIRGSQRLAEAPRLTPEQIEVLDLIDELTSEPGSSLPMDLRPGDVQLLKNSVILHARTPFEDPPPPAPRRHLLRLWVRSEVFDDGMDVPGGGMPTRTDAVPDAELVT